MSYVVHLLPNAEQADFLIEVLSEKALSLSPNDPKRRMAWALVAIILAERDLAGRHDS